MPVDVQIDMTRLERALRTPGGIGTRLLLRRANKVKARAEQLAPGTMAQMITARVEGSGRGMVALVTSEHPASIYVLHGTRPHLIRPRRQGGKLRFEVGGRVVYTNLVRHPGNAANNFLLQSLREVL